MTSSTHTLATDLRAAHTLQHQHGSASKAPFNRAPLRYLNQIPVFCESNEYTENYELISATHLEALARTGHNPFMDETLWQVVEDNTVALANKYFALKGKILDVGVGTGRLLEKLPNSLEKFGVDISGSYLNIAAEKDIQVAMALAEDLPFSDGFFDMVVTTDVLEHVLDLNRATHEMLRVIKPGGVLIARVPYRESLKGYLSSPYKFVHLRNFDEHSLQLFFTKIMECEVLEWSTSGGLVTRDHLANMLPNIFRIAFFLAIHALKFVSKPAWRAMAERFYPHSEIAVVVRKP